MGHQPTHHQHHHPLLLTMKECSGKKVLIKKWLRMIPLTHPAKQIDQVDSKIKEMGQSYMFKKKFIDQP